MKQKVPLDKGGLRAVFLLQGVPPAYQEITQGSVNLSPLMGKANMRRDIENLRTLLAKIEDKVLGGRFSMGDSHPGSR